MRIWALLFQVKSLTFDSDVVAVAGKAFESSVAAVPASAAVQLSSSLHLGTVAGSASADLSAFDAELLYFLALSSSIPFLPSRIPSHSQIFLLESRRGQTTPQIGHQSVPKKIPIRRPKCA